MSVITDTPQPPYYLASFTAQRSSQDEGSAQMLDRMLELVAQQPGYLGIESARDENGTSMTISYWDSIESIQNWKQNAEHLVAQQRGRLEWYKIYTIRIARVESQIVFPS
ncbi:antibiotic biosynthesis monooxygenase [bacterium AH-315-J04]|nr:antibiotic biosynthesis monooxygenase [bacterium AH-315-J04]